MDAFKILDHDIETTYRRNIDGELVADDFHENGDFIDSIQENEMVSSAKQRYFS